MPCMCSSWIVSGRAWPKPAPITRLPSASSRPSPVPFHTQPSSHSPEDRQVEKSRQPLYPSSPQFPVVRGDNSTMPAGAGALHAFLLECEWTGMAKACPHSPPAQCVISSIISPVPHTAVVTFTGEQAGGEVQTSVVSIKPTTSLGSSSSSLSFRCGALSCLEHTSSCCNPTSTLPSPAHEPECMSIPIHSSPVAALCLYSQHQAEATSPQHQPAPAPFMWTGMAKSCPHSPPAQCVVSSITSPVPHATVVTFTGEQGGGEVQTSVVSIKLLELSVQGLSHALNTLTPTATHSATSTLPSPAHEPERMSIRSTGHCRGRHLRRHKLHLKTSLWKS